MSKMQGDNRVPGPWLVERLTDSLGLRLQHISSWKQVAPSPTLGMKLASRAERSNPTEPLSRRGVRTLASEERDCIEAACRCQLFPRGWSGLLLRCKMMRGSNESRLRSSSRGRVDADLALSGEGA